MNQSEATGFDNNPSGQPYGLSFFAGGKVDVCFGLLGPSFWHEHSCQRIRIMFTFDNPLGLVATSYGSVMRDPAWCFEAHQFGIIPAGLLTALDWLRKGPVVVLLVEPSLFTYRLLPFRVTIRDLRPLSRSDPCLVQLAQVFQALCRQKEPPEADFVEGIGIALASRAIAQCFFPHAPVRNPRSALPSTLVEKVVQTIDANLAEQIPASKLAAQAGLSPDHFARRFKIATGMSPRQFVLRRRAEKVDELLRSGKYNVTEAAREAGFHDLSHLNRCFRKFFGYSPKTAMSTACAPDTYR
jgi:AraC-like DNA-binding protein